MDMENNKIIAEFMGYKKSIANTWFKGNKIVQTTSFKYNSDWNWLMEVVEKIEDFFEINGKELEFQIVSYEDEVKVIAKHSDKEWETIVEISADGSGKKENIYNACVEFIKWYNENK